MRLRPLVLVALLAAGIVAATTGGSAWTRSAASSSTRATSRLGAPRGSRDCACRRPADGGPRSALAQEEYPKFLAHVTTVRILEAQDNERLLYEQLAVPFAKDRDVVLRVRRRVDATTGSWEITSTASPTPARRRRSRFVRVRVSDGTGASCPRAAAPT